MKRPALFLSIGLWLLTGPHLSGSAQGPSAELLEARLQAARKAYDGYTEALQIRTNSFRDTVERLYRWSRRILDAERAVAKTREARTEGLKGHLARMADLESKATRFLKVGGAIHADVDAARFFRLEAEIWVAEAKAETKK
jgi:hypothetical protein